jgi:hypothetical protein
MTIPPPPHNILYIIAILVTLGFIIGFLVYVYYNSTSIWYFVGILIVIVIFTIIPFIVPIYWYIFRPKPRYELSQQGGKKYKY